MLLRYSEVQDRFRLSDGYQIELKVATVLRGLGFETEAQQQLTDHLSGGWQMRLALAKLLLSAPDLLLLDEPTNHLDLDMRQALEMALNDYEGAVVLVTHDRHLVSSVCDRLWRVADHAVQMFDGDLEDYARWLSDRARGKSTAAAPMVAPEPVVPSNEIEAAKPAVAVSREDVKRLRDVVRKSETRQQRIEELLRRLEQKLADPALYDKGGAGEAAKLMKEQAELREELARVEEAWLVASGQLEGQGA